MSDQTAGDVRSVDSTAISAAERRERTSSPPGLTRQQNLVLTASVVVMAAVWIAAGFAFVDSFRNPLPPRPALSAAEKSAPSAAEKRPASVAEQSPSAVTGKSHAVEDRPSPAAQAVAPQPPAVVATDNASKPPAAPTSSLLSSPNSPAVSPPVTNASPGDTTGNPLQAEKTPPVVDDNEAVDSAARDAITRGWALYRLPYTPARWQEAHHEFERAFETVPQSSEARIGLAAILSTRLADGWSPTLQEDIPRAEHLLQEAIDKGSFSNRATAHFTVGVIRQMQIRLPEARSEFEMAISLDSSGARSYLHLGETLLYLGQPEAAISPLEHAIRGPNDPDLAITYWLLGTCQLLLGRIDQAIGLLQTARAANARLWEPYFYLAGAYALQGDLEKARSALAESMRLKPAMKSLARMRAENRWLSKPQYWALQEGTLNIGLRRAGLPDQ